MPSPETQMAVMAKDISYIKKTVDELNKDTVTKEEHDETKFRVTRLEKAALWVLGTTFALVFLAVIGLVISQRAH